MDRTVIEDKLSVETREEKLAEFADGLTTRSDKPAIRNHSASVSSSWSS